MKTKDYLKILREEIHSTVFATVDELMQIQWNVSHLVKSLNSLLFS